MLDLTSEVLMNKLRNFRVRFEVVSDVDTEERVTI